MCYTRYRRCALKKQHMHFDKTHIYKNVNTLIKRTNTLKTLTSTYHLPTFTVRYIKVGLATTVEYTFINTLITFK